MNSANNDKMITSAVCGLFCPSCGLYIASQEDETKLKNLALKFGKTPDDIHCDGCRSERLGPFCRNCKIKPCAESKTIQFCSQCDQFPCSILNEFQKEPQFAHRLELFQSLELLKNSGHGHWYEKMTDRYTCTSCGTLNSAYDIKCRKCAFSPGNPYIEAHADEIQRRTAK